MAPPRPTNPVGNEGKAPVVKKEKEKKTPNTPESLVPEVTAPGGEFQALPNRWKFDWPTYKRYADETSRCGWSAGRSIPTTRTS